MGILCPPQKGIGEFCNHLPARQTCRFFFLGGGGLAQTPAGCQPAAFVVVKSLAIRALSALHPDANAYRLPTCSLCLFRRKHLQVANLQSFLLSRALLSAAGCQPAAFVVVKSLASPAFLACIQTQTPTGCQPAAFVCCIPQTQTPAGCQPAVFLVVKSLASPAFSAAGCQPAVFAVVKSLLSPAFLACIQTQTPTGCQPAAFVCCIPTQTPAGCQPAVFLVVKSLASPAFSAAGCQPAVFAVVKSLLSPAFLACIQTQTPTGCQPAAFVAGGCAGCHVVKSLATTALSALHPDANTCRLPTCSLSCCQEPCIGIFGLYPDANACRLPTKKQRKWQEMDGHEGMEGNKEVQGRGRAGRKLK